MTLFFADYSLGILGLRDGPWKLIHEPDSDRSKLFDLEKDPHEHTNVEALHPGQTRWYAQNLRNWSGTRKQSLIAAAEAGK
jgi:hypothetical protein